MKYRSIQNRMEGCNRFHSNHLGMTETPIPSPPKGSITKTHEYRPVLEAKTRQTAPEMSEQHVDSNRLSLHATDTRSTDTITPMTRQSPYEADGSALPTVLQPLDDGKCRTILTLLARPKSASELREECELSCSTVYRKLELLRESGLVREYTDVRRDGPNVTCYERDFTDISITITDNEFTMQVDRPEQDPEDKLATFWSAMKEES